MRGKLHQLKVRLMLKGVCQRGEKALCVIPFPALIRECLIVRRWSTRSVSRELGREWPAR